jgi:hypothetical protein
MALVTGMAVSILNKRFMYNVLLFLLAGMSRPHPQVPCEELHGKGEESAQIII